MGVEPFAVHKGVCKHRHKLVFLVCQRKRTVAENSREVCVKQRIFPAAKRNRTIIEIHHAEDIALVHIPFGVALDKLSLQL